MFVLVAGAGGTLEGGRERGRERVRDGEGRRGEGREGQREGEREGGERVRDGEGRRGEGREGRSDGSVSVFLRLKWSTMFPLTCFLAFPSSLLLILSLDTHV